MRLEHDELRALLDLLAITKETELDCDEFLDRLPRYLDRAHIENVSSENFELLLDHLKICSECREEYEALCRARDSGELN